MRQLPPAAVPVSAADLRAGLSASEGAHQEFRSAVAAYFNLPAAACFLASSGRTVVYTLLGGLATEHAGRRQVVIPAYTCPVIPKVVLDLGLEPVFVDIEPETTCYKQEPLRAAVSDKTLAVFLVHPFGIALPFEELSDAAYGAGAVVIEDGAQAMGARRQGRQAGLAGDYGFFSLGPGKPLSTGGGGIVITGREQNQRNLARWWADLPAASSLASKQAVLSQAIFRLAFHPRSWWAATRLGVQRLGNEETSWGYKVSDLTPAQAAVGLALLPRLDEINRRRRETALRLATAVENATALRTLNITSESGAIFLRLPLLAESEGVRDALFAEMWAAGIGAGRLYEKTLAEIFTPDDAAAYEGATSFARRLLTLPTHYQVSERDIELMEEILAGY
jgi:dTDP-4-amino-4,6-dideoxygalactose transaminase